MRYRDNVCAKTVGLEALSDAQWRAHFGRFEPLEGNLERPLALKYHGHQFQNYNPDLGDGRGFLFAQLRGTDDRLLDLGTKGSGTTPYSRRGDGRLTLLGGVREVLATRYLQSLGVNTSKSLSLIETGEALQRGDEPSPTRSAVLVRLSHSHIRFGTFQRLAYFQNTDALDALIAYCRQNFYPNATSAADFFAAVVKQSAKTVASWMGAGFVHGVMNTDNINITGESFDYGPYRFLPTLKSDFTAAYFDHNKLYAFGRQPEIMYWNLGQLAQSLSLVVEDSALLKALEGFVPAYRQALIDTVFGKLGLKTTVEDQDIAFVLATFKFLEESQAPWPQFWQDWRGGAERMAAVSSGPNAAYYATTHFDAWFMDLKSYEAVVEPNTVAARPASLLYDEIQALWAPIDQEDDWSKFHQKLDSFQPL